MIINEEFITKNWKYSVIYAARYAPAPMESTLPQTLLRIRIQQKICKIKYSHMRTVMTIHL